MHVDTCMCSRYAVLRVRVRTCMYPPPHMTSTSEPLIWRPVLVLSCMYPPPHMTCIKLIYHTWTCITLIYHTWT